MVTYAVIFYHLPHCSCAWQQNLLEKYYEIFFFVFECSEKLENLIKYWFYLFMVPSIRDWYRIFLSYSLFYFVKNYGHKLQDIKTIKEGTRCRNKNNSFRTFDEIKGQQNDATNQCLDELQLQTNATRGSCVIYEFKKLMNMNVK